MRIIPACMHLWVIAKPVKVGGMGGECFPENMEFIFTGYLGRMVRMAVWRDWDAICEEGMKGYFDRR